MTLALDRHIETSSDVRGGTPRLAGTRITVDDVVLMHLRLGQPLEQIAGKYDLTLSALHAAMAYYYDHRAEVDQRLAQSRAELEALRTNAPSLLRDKLDAANGG